jgi:hypothetical protein
MRTLGRHGLRPVDIIKMDLRETGFKTIKWIELRFEISREIKFQIVIFCVMMPCSLVGLVITNISKEQVIVLWLNLRR